MHPDPWGTRPEYKPKPEPSAFEKALRNTGKTITAVVVSVAAVAGAAFGVLGLIIAFMLFGPILGGLSGWVVGWFFGSTILYVLGQFGLHGVEMWQLGMTLGFVGGFLRSVTSTTAAAKKE